MNSSLRMKMLFLVPLVLLIALVAYAAYVADHMFGIVAFTYERGQSLDLNIFPESAWQTGVSHSMPTFRSSPPRRLARCGSRWTSPWRQGSDSRIEQTAGTWQAGAGKPAAAPSPDSIKTFCMTHGISRLRLLGSAGRNDFDPLRSDVDLLVEHTPGKHPGLDHFRIADELSELFGRKVDLNTPAMLERHLRNVLPEAQLLYGET